MYIREELDKENEYLSVSVRPFKKMFLGGVYGILLRPRSSTDKHVMYEILVEDDGHWFPVSQGSGTASSFWFEDHIHVIVAALKWCMDNCEPDFKHGKQYGWRFKD